jgi:hypothetical protein
MTRARRVADASARGGSGAAAAAMAEDSSRHAVRMDLNHLDLMQCAVVCAPMTQSSHIRRLETANQATGCAFNIPVVRLFSRSNCSKSRSNSNLGLNCSDF